VADLTFPAAACRQTVKAPVWCAGVALHLGIAVRMDLQPAAPGSGIIFRRADMSGAEIRARHDRVADTRLCTLLADAANPTCRVGTVEHLLAACAALGLDDALVTVDGPELPILDGSAAPFMDLIAQAGLAPHPMPRRAIKVLRPVRVEEGAGFAELAPATGGFSLDVTIEFPAAAIGRQSARHDLGAEAFRRDIAPARTFALLQEVEAMRQAGLARGGSLDNAIVVDGDHILNQGGFRLPDEFARHKLLDVVGDLALAGAPIIGHYTGLRPGHALNNRLLRALFAEPDAWREAGPFTAAA